MARENWEQTTYIEKELIQNPRSFSFFQAIRLLKSFLNPENNYLKKDTIIDYLKITPNLSFAFQISDIESIKKEDSGKYYTITANILGLYGTGSPLPSFYTEDLFDDELNKETTARDFMDVINHRLYELLFSGWFKYKSMGKILEEKNLSHSNMIFSLIGMGQEELRNDFDDPLNLLRYTGLLSVSPISSSGLETILRDLFKNNNIYIIQAVQRKAGIPDDQKACLGKNIELGCNSLLGTFCIDMMNGFNIKIETIDYEEYRSFLPENKNYKKLIKYTDLYISQPFDYKIELIPCRKPEKICIGDKNWACLGLNTWLFSVENPENIKADFLPEHKKEKNTKFREVK